MYSDTRIGRHSDKQGEVSSIKAGHYIVHSTKVFHKIQNSVRCLITAVFEQLIVGSKKVSEKDLLDCF